MEETSLPQTISSLKTKFNVESDMELVYLLKEPSKLTPVQNQIWKYSGAALFAGRPIDSAIICVAGASGAGKSTTINSFYGDNTLCSTNSWESETSNIVFIRKTLKVTKENPSVLTQLSFVDMPGYFDTNSPEEEASHHAKLQQFKESRIELAKRTDIPLPFRYCYSIPKTVHPNLVLFVIKATDNRIAGPGSQLTKSLKLLKENGELIDTRSPNLIVVVTHVMQLARKPEKIIEMFNEIKKIVSSAIWNIFGLTKVEIVPIENDPEDSDLPKKGDYYELPIKDDLGNNELSHYNLYQAMMERLNENEDLLGRLCMAWYCNTECPDRKIPAEIIQMHIPIDSQTQIELAQDAAEVAAVEIDEPKMCKFQSLGYAFCPVTEKIMHSSPLEHIGEPEVVEIANSKFLIPAGVKVFGEKVSKSHFLTFFKKEEYEGHMHNSYGIEAGVRLVVNANFKGKWLDEAKGSQEQSWISQIHEIQVAKLKLDDPSGHPKVQKFQDTLNSLPDEYSEETAPKFRSFFSKWGSHLICEQGIGGSIQLNCAFKKQEITKEKLTEIQNDIKGVFQQLFVSGDANAENEFKRDGNALRSIGVDDEQLEISGGDPPLLPTLNSFTHQELVKWSESVAGEPAELKRTMKLFPYYNLIKDGEKSQEALRKATEAFLQNSLLGGVENDFKQNQIADDDLEDVIDDKAKASCFPKGTRVFVDGGKHSMAIENLASSCSPQLTTLALHGISDKMKIGNFSNTKFCTFLDAKPEVEIDYLALSFSNGKKLLVSEGHMIFQYIPAKHVVIGKHAKYFKIGEIAVYTDSPGQFPIQYPVVTQITREKHVGAYSPLTMLGTFFAEGFLVSSYANVNSFQLAQCALAPLKMWHIAPHLKKSSKTKVEDDAVHHQSHSSSDGIHPYAKFLIAFRKSFTRHVKKM